MKILELSNRQLGLSGSFVFLLAMGNMLMLMNALYRKIHKAVCLSFALSLCINIGLLQVLDRLCLHQKEKMKFGSFSAAVGNLPAVVLYAVLAILVFILLGEMFYMYQSSRGKNIISNRPFKQQAAEDLPQNKSRFHFINSPAESSQNHYRPPNLPVHLSIQEGMDQLSDGIWFGTMEGVPLLVNKKMSRISQEAFGCSILDTKAFQESLFKEDVRPGCHIYHHKNSLYLQLPDDSIWDIRYHDILLGRVMIKECIAYNVTEWYQKNLELKRRNTHLASMNDKMKIYIEKLAKQKREEEILAAKLRIHDDIGGSLLALKAYLSDEGGNREKLISQWKFTISLLKGETQRDDIAEPMNALAQAACSVGVKLVVDKKETFRENVEKLIFTILHECLTNVVKHAEGDELKASVIRDGNDVLMEVCNNGKPPEQDIIESGGLKNVRSMVELCGGNMQIDSKPYFLLLVRIPL